MVPTVVTASSSSVVLIEDTDTTYTAGAGLNLPGTEFSVDYAGSGAATTSARSDHDHAGTYLTAEVDPQVGDNTTNYVPKWDGTALVTGTIFDNGNIGIGTDTPAETLDVNGVTRTNGLKMPTGAADGYVDRSCLAYQNRCRKRYGPPPAASLAARRGCAS